MRGAFRVVARRRSAPTGGVSILSALAERLAGQAEVLHAAGGDTEPVPPGARPAMFSPDEARGMAGVTCDYFATGDFAAAPLASRPERALGKLISPSFGGGAAG